MIDLRSRFACIAVPALLALSGVASASDATPSIHLKQVDPVDLLAGSVLLRAEVEADPSVPIAEVSFFVDGRFLALDTEPPYEAEWIIGDRFREHLVRVTARAADGRAGHDIASFPPSGPLSTVTAVDRAPEWVEFQVAFLDSAGRPILDVHRDEVVVLEDGRGQELELFEPDLRPVYVILLLDGSDSTRSFWELLGSATRLFGRTLRAGDRASVAAFDKWIYELAPLGSLAEDLPKAMERHQDLGGSTRLYDAMAQSAVYLSARSGEARRALVLLTDGADSASDLRVRDAESYLQEASTEVFSILVYPQDNDSLQYQLYKHSKLDHLRKGMARISKGSGGMALEIDPAELEEAFLQIGEHLRSQYRVGYLSLTRRPDDAARDLRVELRRPGLHRARYRRVHSGQTVPEFLISEMQHKKEHRRRFALGAAAAVPTPEVQRSLVNALAAAEDLESGVPDDARHTLLQLGTVAVPYLLDATASEDPILVRRAAIVLVELLDELTVSGGGMFVLEEVARTIGEDNVSAGAARLQRLTDLDLPDAVHADLRRVLEALEEY